MLVIRREQWTLFERRTERLLETRLLEDARRTNPERCTSLGDAGLRERVTVYADRLREKGFADSTAIARIVSVLFLLDAPEQLPAWLETRLAWDQPDDARADAIERRARLELQRASSEAAAGAN